MNSVLDVVHHIGIFVDEGSGWNVFVEVRLGMKVGIC